MFGNIQLAGLACLILFIGAPLFLSAQTSFLNFKSDFRILLKDSRGYLWGTDPDGRAYISDGYETRDLDRFIPKCDGGWLVPRCWPELRHIAVGGFSKKRFMPGGGYPVS